MSVTKKGPRVSLTQVQSIGSFDTNLSLEREPRINFRYIPPKDNRIEYRSSPTRHDISFEPYATMCLRF